MPESPRRSATRPARSNYRDFRRHNTIVRNFISELDYNFKIILGGITNGEIVTSNHDDNIVLEMVFLENVRLTFASEWRTRAGPVAALRYRSDDRKITW